MSIYPFLQFQVAFYIRVFAWKTNKFWDTILESVAFYWVCLLQPHVLIHCLLLKNIHNTLGIQSSQYCHRLLWFIKRLCFIGRIINSLCQKLELEACVVRFTLSLRDLCQKVHSGYTKRSLAYWVCYIVNKARWLIKENLLKDELSWMCNYECLSNQLFDIFIDVYQ